MAYFFLRVCLNVPYCYIRKQMSFTRWQQNNHKMIVGANTTPIQEEGSSLYCYVMISHAPPYTSYDQRSFIGLLCCVGEHASIRLFLEAREDQHKERVKLPSCCFRTDATDMDPQSSILSRVLDTPAIGKSYAKQAHQTYRALMHWIRIWSGVSCFCSQR